MCNKFTTGEGGYNWPRERGGDLVHARGLPLNITVAS